MTIFNTFSRKLVRLSALFVLFGLVVNVLTPSLVRAEVRSCDSNAVIRCGAYSLTELAEKYKGDVVALYTKFGITSAMINGTSGTVKVGSVTKTGNVIVDGKIVATNAITAGREYRAGSTAIDGGFYQRPAGTNMVSDSVSAFVWLDANGRFMGAVMQTCGNPVMATAKPVLVKVCNPATGMIIDVDSTKAGDYLSAASEKCKDTTVCRLSDKVTVTIKRAVYEANQSAYSTNPDDCKPPVEVCNPETGAVISVPKADEDKYLPKDSDKCVSIKVCVRASGELNKTIRKSDYNETLYSTRDADCIDVKVCYPATKTTAVVKQSAITEKMTTDLSKCETSEVIPNTGIETTLSGLLGAGALSYGTYTYTASRRALQKIPK